MVTLSQSIAFSFLTKHLSHTVAVRMFCSLKCGSKANMNFFFLVHDFTDRRLTLSVCVCVCVCTCPKLLQSIPTLCDPVVCSSSGSSVHGFLQARILQSVSISFCRKSCQPRDRTWVSNVSCTGRWVLYH